MVKIKGLMKGLFMANTHTYTRKEEVANAITHGIGALLSVAALVVLIVFSTMKGTAWHIASFSIYGTTMLILYINSTLVHSFKEGRVKDLFEIFDHSSIYLFIAGSYTPFMLVAIRGPLGWSLFATVWGLHCSAACSRHFYEAISVYVHDFLHYYGVDGRGCLGASDGRRGFGRHLAAGCRRDPVHAWYRFLCVEGLSVSPCDLAFVCTWRERDAFLCGADLSASLVVKIETRNFSR